MVIDSLDIKMANKNKRRKKKMCFGFLSCGQNMSPSPDGSLDEERGSTVQIDSKQDVPKKVVPDIEVPIDPVFVESRNELIMNMKNLIEQNFKELKDLRQKKAKENIALHKQELKLYKLKQIDEEAEEKLKFVKNEYDKEVNRFGSIGVAMKLNKFNYMKPKNKEEILLDLNYFLRKQRILKEEIPRLKREYEIRKNWTPTVPPVVFSPAMVRLNVRMAKELGAVFVLVKRQPVEKSIGMPLEVAKTEVNSIKNWFGTILRNGVKLSVTGTRYVDKILEYYNSANTDFKQRCAIQLSRSVNELNESTVSLFKVRNEAESSLGIRKRTGGVFKLDIRGNTKGLENIKRDAGINTRSDNSSLVPVNKGGRVHLTRNYSSSLTRNAKDPHAKRTSIALRNERSVSRSKNGSGPEIKHVVARKSVVDKKGGSGKISGQMKSNSTIPQQAKPVSANPHNNKTNQLSGKKTSKTDWNKILNKVETKVGVNMTGKQNNTKASRNGSSGNGLTEVRYTKKGTYVQNIGKENFIYAKRPLSSNIMNKIDKGSNNATSAKISKIIVDNRIDLQNKGDAIMKDKEENRENLNDDKNSQQLKCFPVRTTARPLIIIGQTHLPILIRGNGANRNTVTWPKSKNRCVNKDFHNIKLSRIPVYRQPNHAERKPKALREPGTQTCGSDQSTKRSLAKYANRRIENIDPKQHENTDTSFQKGQRSSAKNKVNNRQANIGSHNNGYRGVDDKMVKRSAMEKATYNKHRDVSKKDIISRSSAVQINMDSSPGRVKVEEKVAKKSTDDVFAIEDKKPKLPEKAVTEGFRSVNPDKEGQLGTKLVCTPNNHIDQCSSKSPFVLDRVREEKDKLKSSDMLEEHHLKFKPNPPQTKRDYTKPRRLVKLKMSEEAPILPENAYITEPTSGHDDTHSMCNKFEYLSHKSQGFTTPDLPQSLETSAKSCSFFIPFPPETQKDSTRPHRRLKFKRSKEESIISAKQSSEKLVENHFLNTPNPPETKKDYNKPQRLVRVKRSKIEESMLPQNKNITDTNGRNVAPWPSSNWYSPIEKRADVECVNREQDMHFEENKYNDSTILEQINSPVCQSVLPPNEIINSPKGNIHLESEIKRLAKNRKDIPKNVKSRLPVPVKAVTQSPKAKKGSKN